MAVFKHLDAGRQDGAGVDKHVAGYLHAVADDAAVADDGVVADVALGEDKRVAADLGSPTLVDAAVDDRHLAYHGVVANGHKRVLAFPTEILRRRADDGAVVDFHVLAETGALHDARIGHHDATVAYLHVLVDEGEWIDVDIFADFCRRVNEC